MEIGYTADDRVRAAIARVGRTEDARFSPGGGRLALTGFHRNRLLVLELEVRLDERPARVALTGCLEVKSAALGSPHGLCWVGERDLIVANRETGVAIFALPAPGGGSAAVTLSPVRRIGGDPRALVSTAGAVLATPVGLDLVELIVCNNLPYQLSRHLLDRRDDYRLLASAVMIEDGLELPDGLARSPSGRWLAVSNHDRHCVFLYRADARLDRSSRPDGVLRGLVYPHGLAFAGEACLFVAEAGTPVVRAFRSADGDWSGERAPDAAIPVVPDDVFARANRINHHEGGPKGIDVTRDARLMVASCEQRTLAFFDLRSLVEPPASLATGIDEASEAGRARETLLRYLACAREAVADPTEASLSLMEREIHALLDSRSWRLTAPLRRAAATLRRRVSRRRRR